eukprot:SAG31_NODE_5495_length_2502_cov_2.230129_2_plen_235_part_00
MLSLLSEALDLLFPPEPRRAMNWLSVLAANIHGILQLECWGVDWYDRWTISVCVVPLCAFTPIVGRWLWQRRQGGLQGKVAAMRQGLSTAFFVVMLLYPRVSAKIFAMLRCRWLGPEGEGPAILEDDYKVDCMSEEYRHYWVAASILVVLIPIGIPLVALTVLLRTARATSTELATTAIALAVDDEEPDEFNSELIDGLDERVKARVHVELSSRFAFLVDDYRPGCYWYEPGAE